MDQPNNGYLYVASTNKRYLRAAEYSAISLKDYYPEANITLATEEHWIEDRHYDMFDHVIVVSGHYRAKLEALYQTPYDLTFYLDSDTEIMSEDIAKVFDEMTETADIMLTKIREYSGAEVYFPGGELEDHCGAFLYRKTDKVMEFCRQWFERYVKQRERWDYDTKLYPKSLRFWDQFTYWWLQNKTEYAIVREYFKDPDCRWNFIRNYKDAECPEDQRVVWHYTIPTKHVDLDS